MNKEVLHAYRNGKDLTYIAKRFNTSTNEIKEILLDYKEASKYKRTFTDDFKRLIAERDMNDVSRRQIATELEINANTVKKACERFGQSLKEVAPSGNEYTKIEGNFDMNTCPSCLSDKVNEVAEFTTFCLSCGNEVIHKENHALKVNWEFLD